MKRLKPVLPSLREKKRYLAFEVISKSTVSFTDVSNAITTAVLTFCGELGLAKAGILILHDRYDTATQRGIIRVSRKEVDTLKAALVLHQDVGKEQAIIRSLGVSGILNKAESKYIHEKNNR